MSSNEVSDAKKALNNIMQDKGLAALGDTYVNFVFSLARSRVSGKPQGVRVRDKILAKALKDSGLRNYLLPKRLSSHELGNAAESVIIHSWLRKLVSLDEAVSILSLNIKNIPTRGEEWEESVKGFTSLLLRIKEKLKIDT